MKTSFAALLSFLILLCSCTSQSDKNSKKFTLQGEISNQDTGIIILTYWSDDTSIIDTANIKKRTFVFTGKIPEPSLAVLSGRNGIPRVFVFLENQNMKIFLSKDKPENYKMTGSKTHDDYSLLNKVKEPFYGKISIIRDQKNKINDSIKNSKSFSDKELLEREVKILDEQWSQTLKQIDSIDIKYVLDNPKSFLAVERLSGLGANEKISLDSTKIFFDGLDSSLKQTSYGKDISEIIRKKENILIGKQAPDFKATALNKQIVTLSQFKGESAVLMDFWASWCVPCRMSTPHLKMLYNKYHSRGFEVIAVSNDEDNKAWIGAVNQDSTAMWYHIPYAEKWPCKLNQLTNDDVYQNYFVQAIPQQILIDKNGKIVYRHVGYSKENEESLTRQLSLLFEN